MTWNLIIFVLCLFGIGLIYCICRLYFMGREQKATLEALRTTAIILTDLKYAKKNHDKRG